jgi:hypothetical protein
MTPPTYNGGAETARTTNSNSFDRHDAKDAMHGNNRGKESGLRK